MLISGLIAVLSIMIIGGPQLAYAGSGPFKTTEVGLKETNSRGESYPLQIAVVYGRTINAIPVIGLGQRCSVYIGETGANATRFSINSKLLHQYLLITLL